MLVAAASAVQGLRGAARPREFSFEAHINPGSRGCHRAQRKVPHHPAAAGSCLAAAVGVSRWASGTRRKRRAALRREMRERLDVDIEVGQHLATSVHDYEGYSVTLVVYQATLLSERVDPVRVNAFHWASSERVRAL